MTADTRARDTAAGQPVAPLGRTFHVHLTGVGLANIADGIMAAAVPLIAVTLTRSPLLVSLISVAFFLPWLLFGILAGVVVDRTDRRRTQLAGMAVRVTLLVTLTTLLVSDRLTMPLLIAVAFGYGITDVVVDLAGSSIVPSIAPRSRLSAANGRVLAVQQVCATFVGAPIAAGLLVLGAGWAAGVPAALAVTFLLVVGLGMRGSYRVERTGTATGWAEVTEGARFLLRHPVLRPLLVSGSVLNMANTGYFAVFVLWVVGAGSQVGLAAEHYPLLVMLLAVGAVVGSLLAERLVRRWAEMPLMFACWGVNSVGLLVPLLWPRPVPIAATFLVLGVTNTIGNVIGQTVRQRLVPGELLGRVGGAARTIGYGLMPLGAVLGGQVAETWGLPAVFVGATVTCLLAVAYVASQVSQSMVDAHDTQAGVRG
ncbi:MFS transporter [Ornithinimicrobium sediminis]|uniref:MFS transporter n=1 Tax=Ornithinimicrobium sediminis TaxID=2904603 RepID=UPI001E30B8C2|nr:MFS transporter [Ornithinimicrobium sediminis]MCE0487481.1 MFS transporter [Ornithinimicrobium sediminis]